MKVERDKLNSRRDDLTRDIVFDKGGNWVPDPNVGWLKQRSARNRLEYMKNHPTPESGDKM